MHHVSCVTSYKSGYNNLPQNVSEKCEKEKTGRRDLTYRPKIACVQNRIYCPPPKKKTIHNIQKSILFFKLQNFIN